MHAIAIWHCMCQCYIDLRLAAQAQRRVLCPTCRTRTLVADIAYVDAGRAPAAGAGSGGGGADAAADADVAALEAAEERIVVRGSYGTKVRRHPDSQFRTRVVTLHESLCAAAAAQRCAISQLTTQD